MSFVLRSLLTCADNNTYMDRDIALRRYFQSLSTLLFLLGWTCSWDV